MILSVYGHTDKRPIMFTILKVIQSLGDCLLVTQDRHYLRLLEEGETVGHFQNIMIVVTDSSPDEVFEEIGHNATDFEHVIYDGFIAGDSEHVIYVQGAMQSEEEEATLEYLEGYETIQWGFGRHKVPYSVAAFKNVELAESKGYLPEIDPRITAAVSKALSKAVGMSASNIGKVVKRK